MMPWLTASTGLSPGTFVVDVPAGTWNNATTGIFVTGSAITRGITGAPFAAA
jgi:hypothetical protein